MSNFRKIKVHKSSPIQSKGYLESKVVKVEDKRNTKATTSTPKKKENKRTKLKETNKRTKEILSRLETKIGATATKTEKDDKQKIQQKNKVRKDHRLTLSIIMFLIPGCRSLNTTCHQYSHQHSFSGGNKIYIVVLTLFMLLATLPTPFPSPTPYFQVPVHRRCLLQVLLTSTNLQYSKFQKSVRFYDVKMPVVISDVRDLIIFSVI